MGYGKKTDFKQNKSFDPDKTYRNIIKPAAQAAGYTASAQTRSNTPASSTCPCTNAC
jgi:hypothetical protein